MMNAKKIFVTTIGLVIWAASFSVEAARFFRYEDENGRLVMSHTIPNDRVPYGYEIVDETARVIQTVDPQLSEIEYQKKVARERATTECRNLVDRVHNLYQSLDDIDYAEKQALESLDTQINNNKANLIHVRNQRTELESQAAQLDIAGRPISPMLLDNIESARTQERNLEEQVEQRYAQKLKVRKAYDFDRAIFHVTECDDGLSDDLRAMQQRVAQRD